MTWSEKVMLHTSRSVSLVWPHLLCFHRSRLVSIKSYSLKSAGNLSWPGMTLATWRGVTGRNIPTQGVNFICNLMFESVSNGFRPKEVPFIFLPLTYNGEVAKLNWCLVTPTDIKTPRYTFYRYWYGYQSLIVSRWSVLWCSYDEHSNFLWGEVNWRDLVTWPWVTWVWHFYKVCRKDVKPGVPKTAALCDAVFWKSAFNTLGR